MELTKEMIEEMMADPHAPPSPQITEADIDKMYAEYLERLAHEDHKDHHYWVV